MSDGLEKCAMFLIGFNILQMMNVYLVGSEFALKRFEVSSSKVSVFIASVQSVRSLATLLALVVGVILLLIGDNFLSKDYRKYWNQAGAILSAFLLTFFAFLQLICFCSSHGHQYVVHYYWLHVASGLCVGLIQMYGFKIFGGEASYYSLGNQLIGCFASALHFTLKKVLNSFQLDINFWLIAIHLFVVFLVAFLGFLVFSAAVLLKDQKNGSGSSGSSSSPQTTEDAGYAVWGVLFVQSGLVFFIGFAFQEDLLFQEGFGITAGLLILAGFVNLIVFTVAILLPANSSSDSVLVALLFPTILAFVSGLLILSGFLYWGVIMFCVGFVIFVVVTYVVLLQSDSSAAIWGVVMFPTILAFVSGLLILYGFMFWGVIMFLVSVVLFIIFLMAAVVGFPSDPSKALGAWALLLIFAVLVFLTILLFQAGHGTVAGLLFLVGIVTVVFTSASSGVSKNPPSFDKFKLGVQGAWAPIVMAVLGLAFLYVIYPVIGPILTVESSKHHTILIWCLLLEATSGITVYLWLEKDTNIKKGKWHSESGYHYYFFLWLFFIPYFYFGMTLLWALHHPNANFAKTIKFGVWGGVMSCVYYFSAKIISNIGYGCVHGHAKEGVGESDETAKKTIAGYVSTLNVFLANLFLVLFTFLGNAHLSNFFMYTGKLAEGHVFPTSSMNGFRSCWFWFSCASSGAWKNFISLFSLDIKEMLLS
ncbi:hypothetical protein BdWA1_003351 [Babesia duncani]|uniref:Uncharacterized protein n=1 Tax=Babesia duncani TaxID=323732 RepID=A0AAD9PIA8_9APIC|nr:hypothetical protein BdWA1_003351 [Babesia duncani]